MTVQELSQYYYARREADAIRDDLRKFENTSVGVSRFDGMPQHGDGRGRTESDAARHADLQAKLKAAEDRAMAEWSKLEGWLATVSDSRLRLIFRCRFVKLESWAQVAIEVGGGNTESGVKMAAYRYLKETKNL